MSQSKAATRMKRDACKAQTAAEEQTSDDVAAYAFDMLQSLRETCSADRHQFLSYLMGMAAEEALRLSEGLPSAAAQFAKPASSPRVSKKHCN